MLGRIVKYIAFLIWSIPILEAILLTIIMVLNPDYRWGGLITIPIILGFYFFTFIVDIPYICVLVILLYLAKRKYKQRLNYYYLILLLDFLVIGAWIVLSYQCQQDYYCRTNDAPLGSSTAWLNGTLSGHLFWTLPLYVFVNKKVLSQEKSKEIPDTVAKE